MRNSYDKSKIAWFTSLYYTTFTVKLKYGMYSFSYDFETKP